MEKVKNTKKFDILCISLLILILASGYVAYSTKVKLNAKGNIKSNKLTLDPNGGILDITSKRVTKGKAYGSLQTQP